MDMYEAFRNSTKKRLDDTIDFECADCGECCKNVRNIILNPLDIFRIAQYMELSNKELIAQYCEQYVANNSKLLVTRVKPSAVCPFLKDSRCGINTVKPIICKLYPMGRIQMGENELIYFLQNVTCGQRGKPIKLRDWLKNQGVTDDDAFGKLWRDIIVLLAMPLVGHQLLGPVQSLFYAVMNKMLYCNYGKDSDFHKQFETNISELKKIYRQLDLI